MLASTVFHEDVFYEFFRPFRHPSSEFKIWGGLGLEPFGSDLQVAKDYSERFVWTVLDGCKGPDQWIAPGRLYVNRVCYLLTEVAHDWVPVEFRIEFRSSGLTTTGLARRVSALHKLMLANTEALAGQST